MNFITITIAKTRGSTPREEGTAMRVFTDRQEGSIGGGALEWEATKIAREMLSSGDTETRRVMPLGPALGQCCGGSVELSFHAGVEAQPEPQSPVWIWGAGHVGSALAHCLAPLPQIGVTLVDFDTGRLPDPLPQNTTPLIATDPARLIPHAPMDAHHLIMTHSHELDLNLCHGLLTHGFQTCGLIGSATKWVRFQKRLRDLGHGPAAIGDITCPIGDPALGKHPQQIAIGVAADLIRATQRQTLKEIAS